MKWRRYRQKLCHFRAEFFCVRANGFNRLFSAGNNDLAWGIVIGDFANTAAFVRVDCFLSSFDIDTDQCSHSALTYRNRRLHRLAANAQ